MDGILVHRLVLVEEIRGTQIEKYIPSIHNDAQD
jgi:hypothetical protein